MAQASQQGKAGGGLLPRVLASLVMAPPVLAALYFGSPYIDILVILGLGLLAGEWAGLCLGGKREAPYWTAVAGALLALLAGRFLGLMPGLALLFISAGVASLLASRAGQGGKLLLLGGLYLPAACFAFLWVRDLPQGRELAIWIMLAVWATDSGAYAAGRLIGGPKLLPRISPKKTWAGLLGGMASAALVGLCFSFFLEGWGALLLILLGALLAIVAQAGDFLESGVKRHYGVKDASSLIPGHGGLLDRVDGLLMASLFMGALLALSNLGAVDG